ncbi:large conductance mechanosensitive channel protein MscL [Paracoccus sp. Z118]|nr:large conductance mechanosensitive channel protein MscL [Paracoccus sp. Z118]
MVMIKEFRDFIAKGNVMDMAVGIIIGAAFTAIVSSMVSDLIEPILGLVTGGTDFSNYFIAMDWNDYPGLSAARDAGAPVFAYGSFITAVINFLIIAFVVFLLVKGVNRIKETAMRKQVAEDSAAGPSSEALLAEIRDLLAGGATSQTVVRAGGDAAPAPEVTPARPPA